MKERSHERKEPYLIQAYHYFNKSRKICALSYLHISFSVNSDKEYMSAVDPALCQSLSETKKFLGIPLEALSADLHGSENAIHYSYPYFFGEKCTSTTNVYVEKGEIATFNGINLVNSATWHIVTFVINIVSSNTTRSFGKKLQTKHLLADMW